MTAVDGFKLGYTLGVAICLLIFAYAIYEQEIKTFGKRWLAHEIKFLREYQEAA